jgi:mRNA interferase MazF
MKARIVRIGNSKGIRIPKPLIEQTGLSDEVTIEAPMTTKGRPCPTRIRCRFGGKTGQVVLDQMRAVDQARLVRRLGRIDRRAGSTVLAVLHEMFSP